MPLSMCICDILMTIFGIAPFFNVIHLHQSDVTFTGRPCPDLGGGGCFLGESGLFGVSHACAKLGMEIRGAWVAHVPRTARSVAQWLKRSPFKRMVWGSIPLLATKWVALVTLNTCGWDNMSLVA